MKQSTASLACAVIGLLVNLAAPSQPDKRKKRQAAKAKASNE
jgi:hypothetical protein